MVLDPLSSEFIETSINQQKENMELLKNLKIKKFRERKEQVPKVKKVKFFMSPELRTRLKALKNRQHEPNIIVDIVNALLKIRVVPEDSINYLGLSNDDFSKISYLSSERVERTRGQFFIEKYITPSTILRGIFEEEVSIREEDGTVTKHLNMLEYSSYLSKDLFRKDKLVKLNRLKEYAGQDDNGLPVFKSIYNMFSPVERTPIGGPYFLNPDTTIDVNWPTRVLKRCYFVNLKEVKVGAEWDHTLRHHQSIHKILTKLFGDKYTEREKNLFAEHYFKLVVSNNSALVFNVVPNTQIKEHYIHRKYFGPPNNSPLWNSCMRYESCESYLNFYEAIEEVKLAVLTIKGKLVARALVWNIDDVVYFDRVYYYNEEYLAIMENYLENAGFVRLRHNNSAGSPMYHELKIHFPSHKFEYLNYVPYVDSFQYYDIRKETLSNYVIREHENYYIFNQTDGSFDQNYQYAECDCCGREVNADELTMVGQGPGTNDHYCDNCQVYSEEYGEHISRDYASYCDFTDSWLLETDMVELHNGKYCYAEYYDLCEFENGFGYFVKGDEDYVEVDSCYYHPDDPNIPQLDEEMHNEQDEPTI